MKYLICLLLSFVSLDGLNAQSGYGLWQVYDGVGNNNITECEINHKRIEYDACFVGPLEIALKHYPTKKWLYLGGSHIYYINNVKNVSKQMTYFFQLKEDTPRVKDDWKWLYSIMETEDEHRWIDSFIKKYAILDTFQQSTYQPGDSIWLTSDDTTKVKVGKYPWDIGSDTAKGLTFHPKLFNIKSVDNVGDGPYEPTTIHSTDPISTMYYSPAGNIPLEKIYSIGEEFPPFDKDHTKYDTIAGWHLVSDTLQGHWNPVSAMYLYEVRRYEASDYLKNVHGTPLINPKHYQWLDSNKKPIKMAVWAATIQ